MHKFQNNNRSESRPSTPREDGNIGKAFTDASDQIKEKILQANSVNILNLFKSYGVRIDEVNHKTTCPFPFHKGGRESTASFYFYPQTNTFWCFGCKTGNYCCDFVAAMENITKYNAALKILNNFKTEINIESEENKDYFEKFLMMKSFSNEIRNYISLYNDENTFIFIEEITQTFDKLIDKYPNLSNEALKTVINKLTLKIKEHNSCL